MEETDKAVDITKKLFTTSGNVERYVYLELLIRDTRPKDKHIDHWRFDIHTLLLAHYKDARELQGYRVEEAEPIAYMRLLEDILCCRVHEQLVYPELRQNYPNRPARVSCVFYD